MITEVPISHAETTIKRWQIWHLYATYARYPLLDVSRAARRFVESELAVAAVTSSGEAWWTADGGPASAMMTARGRGLALAATGPVSPYAVECLATGLHLEGARRHTFPGSAATPRSYVRAFLEPMALTLPSNNTVLLYPQVLVDGSGVILTEFRTLSPDGGNTLSEFIDEHVNLFEHEATSVTVPPGPLRWFLRGVLGPMHGWRASRLDREAAARTHDLQQRRGVTSDAGEFSSPVVSISRMEAEGLRRPHDPKLGLRFLGQLTEIAVAAAVMSRSEVLGQRNARMHASTFPLGEPWSGKPAIYLLASQDDARSTADRVAESKNDLARIVSRSPVPQSGIDAVLGPNLRGFDDYAVFINSATYLWVCERSAAPPRDGAGADPLAEKDPNGDQVVCAKQVLVEHAETVWASHMRLAALAEEPKSSLAEMTRVEQDLRKLGQYAREHSRYGEIWVFLAHAGEQQALDTIRERIKEGLHLRAVVLGEEREAQQQRFGCLLTVLLGIGASETLANRFVVPLLEHYKRQVHADPLMASLLVSFFSLCLVVLAVALLWYFTIRRTPPV